MRNLFAVALIAAAMGVLGWILRQLDVATAPIVLGAILAPMVEMSVRQSLAMSDGHYAIFLTRPIAAGLLAAGVLLLLLGWMLGGMVCARSASLMIGATSFSQ